MTRRRGIESGIYRGLRIYNDGKAIRRAVRTGSAAPVFRRAARRAAGRGTGRLFGKLFG